MIHTIEEIKALISPIALKYNLSSVFVFGSYARNEATENSDIDILIDRNGSNVKSLFDLSALYGEITDSLNKEIDIITTHTLKQKKTRENNENFIKNIEKDKVKIYDREGL